eukprot:6064300-Pleurochrysis_carterae.AAC.10
MESEADYLNVLGSFVLCQLQKLKTNVYCSNVCGERTPTYITTKHAHKVTLPLLVICYLVGLRTQPTKYAAPCRAVVRACRNFCSVSALLTDPWCEE